MTDDSNATQQYFLVKSEKWTYFIINDKKTIRHKPEDRTMHMTLH